MARTQFLKPRSVELPSQGDFTFTPLILVFDEATPQLLQAAMNLGALAQGQDVTQWAVIEEIEYQVYTTPNPQSANRFTAMVWATQVDII